jgi:NAD(P)-dependent dehydrogenase (short-subunit alcohol dehydrogenase family)
MDYRDRHVIVTGGTGALGTAVVTALVTAGASCHIPVMHAAEAERFALREHGQVKLVTVTNLADEGEVARLYGGVPRLWASIHLAGGFAMTPIGEAKKSDLIQQLETNLVTTFLCCRAAVNAMTRGGDGGRVPG